MSDRLQLRDLRSLDECREVVALQEEVWGVDGETVPASVLFVSAKRGGILIGAIARAADVGDEEPEDALAGFVWSLPWTASSRSADRCRRIGLRLRPRRVGRRLRGRQPG